MTLWQRKNRMIRSGSGPYCECQIHLFHPAVSLPERFLSVSDLFHPTYFVPSLFFSGPPFSRVNKFKEEYKELKIRFESAKKSMNEAQRSDLLSVGSSALGGPGASSSAYDTAGVAGRTRHRGAAAASTPIFDSPFGHGGMSDEDIFRPNAPPTARADHALREHTFLQESENAIDGYLAQGKAVLENLVEQRQILRGTRRRLVGAAETLGLSRDVIGWVERRR